MASAGGDRPEPWEEGLLAELRELGRAVDPVPPAVVFAARGSFAWRRVDAELADLTFDSLLDSASLATVRGGDDVRLVTFEAPEVTVEVEITETGAQRRLLGQLVPAQPAQVQVRTGSGTTEVNADELGRFAIDGVAAGPASLRCRMTAADRVVETGWVIL